MANSSSGPSRSATAWVRAVVGASSLLGSQGASDPVPPQPEGPSLVTHQEARSVEGSCTAKVVKRKARHAGSYRENDPGGAIQGAGMGDHLVAAHPNLLGAGHLWRSGSPDHVGPRQRRARW